LIAVKGYDIAANVKTLEAKYTALLQKNKMTEAAHENAQRQRTDNFFVTV
jgi:outer membrane murein-binding lipoprotein Lpp